MYEMADMPQMLALFLMLLILYIGDVVSVRSKAWIPSVFVCAVLFLLGYWTIFPKDIVARGGVPNVVAIMLMYLLITNMGTLLSVRELVNQWKTILISLSGIAGVVVVTFLVGNQLFDMNTVIVSIPPLVGGIVSAIIMSDGATKAGLDNLAVLAIILYVMQGFVGYPLTSMMLKREGNRVLNKYRSGLWKGIEDTANGEVTEVNAEEKMPRLFTLIPAQYNTNYFRFLRVVFVGYLAYLAADTLDPFVKVSPFVLCLLFGVIATSLGFLEKHPLQKANGFGFAVMGLMLFVFNTLQRATPQMLVDLIYPLVVLIVCTVVGMYLFSWLMGRLLNVSKELAFSITLTALYGFPADYIITNEVITMITKDKKEQQVLTSHMMGPMLVGGFISVTIVSVVLAGFMVGYINPAL